jgi:hypothetical protein
LGSIVLDAPPLSATLGPEYDDALAICYSALEQPAMLEHSRAFYAAATEARIWLQ